VIRWLISDEQGTRGRFVVFEGLDGAGTTTQQSYLANWLTDAAVAVETTKEPTSGPLGGVIRQAIDKRTVLDPVALALAFAADRADHVTNPINGIAKSLHEKKWVLCDRYLFSSLAYQSVAGIDTDWILEINRFAISPDVTIFIDTDPEVCMDRIRSRSSHEELFHDQSLLQQTRAIYGKVIDDERLTGKLIVVDGNNKPDDVAHEIQRNVTEWLESTS
jgi:dTMP kinase